MAAKKKTAPVKSTSKSKPVASKALAKKTSAKQKSAATPAKAKQAAKPSKQAAPPKAAPPKAASPKAAPPKAAPKPKTAAKAAPVAKPTEAVKASKPKASVATTQDAAGAGLDVGSAAPAFELLDESGASVGSSALAGKPYLLYFYPKDDTPGCTKEACDIRDNFGRFGKQGLRVLGVSPDSQQSHAKFGKKYGLPFTLLSDPEKTLAKAYGVWGEKNNYGKKYLGIIRSSFLVGSDGLVKKAYRSVKVNGHVDAVLEDARALL